MAEDHDMTLWPHCVDGCDVPECSQEGCMAPACAVCAKVGWDTTDA